MPLINTASIAMMDKLALFPPNVSMVTASAEMWETPVFEVEERLISGAVVKRQREFRAGRHCAHAAMELLGHPRQPILRDAHRAPIWPTGFLGSISHCRDQCVAACAKAGPLIGLGLDIEPLEPLTPGVERYIQTPRESAYLKTFSPALPGRLVFSAKESLYKCFYPLLKRFIGFQAVEILFDVKQRHFSYQPTPQSKIRFPQNAEFFGRYLLTETHLITACYLTQTSRPKKSENETTLTA